MNLNEYIERINALRDARDWRQFHTKKDMAISLSLEASEVLEHFQWKTLQETEQYILSHREDIGAELADVFYWVVIMTHDLGLDLFEMAEKKLDEIENKYPIAKSKGRSVKYNKL